MKSILFLNKKLISLDKFKTKKGAILIFFVLICMIVFLVFNYNFSKMGNNINRSQEEVVENILKNFNSYEANIEVTVKSNKNENYYNISQIVENGISKQIVNEPEEIKDMTILYENNKLKITNMKFNFEKEYDNYSGILNNSLFLDVFEKDYRENESEIYEENDEIIVEIQLANNPNTYVKYKCLHLNKKTKLPKKLIIKDNTQNPYISIVYNEIKIK